MERLVIASFKLHLATQRQGMLTELHYPINKLLVNVLSTLQQQERRTNVEYIALTMGHIYDISFHCPSCVRLQCHPDRPPTVHRP